MCYFNYYETHNILFQNKLRFFFHISDYYDHIMTSFKNAQQKYRLFTIEYLVLDAMVNHTVISRSF